MSRLAGQFRPRSMAISEDPIHARRRAPDRARSPPAAPRRPVTAAPPYRAAGFSTLYGWYMGLVIASVVLILIGIGVLTAIGALIIHMMILYRAWSLIQDGHQETTPGLAVGLRFVPLFNLYWVFIANYKLAVNLNGYVRRHGIQVQPCNAGIALTYCILIILSIIPYLGILFILTNVVMALLMHADYKRVASAIAEARLQGGTHAPLSGGFA